MKKFVLSLFFASPLILYAQESTLSVANKAMLCIACHGQQGQSTNPEWPNLSGQHRKYFIKQLNEMKEGGLRHAPIMSPVLATLSEQDIDDLAAYYAKMPLSPNTAVGSSLQVGERLYRLGDFAKGIAACTACHGPSGKGNAQAAFPVISGQHAAYTLLQLKAFKDGERKNDLNHIMQDISNRMNEKEMQAVADYIERLH